MNFWCQNLFFLIPPKVIMLGAIGNVFFRWILWYGQCTIFMGLALLYEIKLNWWRQLSASFLFVLDIFGFIYVIGGMKKIGFCFSVLLNIYSLFSPAFDILIRQHSYSHCQLYRRWVIKSVAEKCSTLQEILRKESELVEKIAEVQIQ